MSWAKSLDELAIDSDKLYELAMLNDEVAINARPSGNYIRHKKAIDRPTQEAIDEYNKQFERTQVDDEGRVRKFFVPENIPILEEFQPSVEPLDEQEIAEATDELKQFTDEYGQLQAEIVQLELDKQELRRKLNEAEMRDWDEINTQIDFIDGYIIDDRERISELEGLITAYQLAFSENDRNKSIYQAELQNVKKINKERIKSYKEELSSMNQGAFSMSQAPDETEEEYLDRIQQNAEALDPDEIGHKAVANALRNFKLKMRELVRNEVIIGQVSNRIDDFGQIENKMKILKTFPKFKKYFLEKYGFNNEQITPELIVDEITKYIEKVEKPTVIIDKAVDDLLDEEEAEVEYEFHAPVKKPFPGLQFQAQPEIDRVKIMNVKQDPPTLLFLRPALIGRKIELLFSFTGNPGSWLDWKDTKVEHKTKDVVQERTGILLKELEIAFNAKTVKGIAENLNRIYEVPYATEPALSLEYTEDYVGRTKTETISRYGMGINHHKKGGKGETCGLLRRPSQSAVPLYGFGLPEELPDYAQFGKCLILVRKLFYDNILSLVSAKKKQFKGFKTVKVSEKFVELIMQMLKGYKPTSKDLKSLDAKEREIYDELIQLSGLHKSIEHTGDKTVEELKKRLELIEGEIGVGNDNPELLKELYSTVSLLVHFKKITPKEAKSYLGQFL